MRKFLMFSIMLMLIGGVSWAQRTVTGRVTDANGVPVPGASVQVKGTTIGTVTREDGSFSLTVPANGRSLVVSAVGQATQETTINNQSSINVSLQTGAQQNMQEVVVVGYGTQRRREVTSSVSRISGDAVNDQPLPSIDKQIAGKSAGVNINLGTGIVNAEPRIRIRGVNSVNLSRDPLIVVDGVPVASSREGGLSGIANTNPLSDINPADVESVDVLKDGAATAIYGSRAANGVILITTKKGRGGRNVVTYDMFTGFSTAFRKPKMLNAQEFVTIANEKLTNANLTADARMNNENSNTDWLDVVFRDRATASSHTLSMSGGTDRFTYYVSANATNLQGIIETNFTKRYNVRANFELRPNKFVRFGNNITLSKVEDNDQNNGGNALSGAMAAALRSLPNVRVYDPTNQTGYNLFRPSNDALGSDSNRRKIENNYVNIRYVLDRNKFNSDKYRIIENAFIELTPIEGLAIRSQGSLDYQTGTDFQSLDPIHGDGRGSLGSVFNQNLQRTRFVWQNYFNYNKRIAEVHSIGVTGGVEIQSDIFRSYFGQGTGLSDVFFATDNLISGTFVNQFSGGSYDKGGFQSFFGRLTYDFRGKYFVQASFRRDGQSRLAEDKRYGTFPGVSVGWRVSDEGFWKNSGVSRVINEFKLRGSYAIVGNTITSGYPYLSTYGPAQYGAVSGNAINRVGNPELQWETNKKINVGTDISFLSNRLNLTIDYYKNNNDELIFNVPTPVSLGIPGNNISRNIGSMVNKGWEFSLNGDVVRSGGFVWNVNLNFTSQRNRVESLFDSTRQIPVAGPNNGTFNALIVGQPINAIFGYQYVGVNSANGNPMWQKANGSLVQYNVVPGAAAGYYLVVKPGDPALGALSSLAAADRVILGSPIPTWFGGFTNTFSFKGLSLDVFFRYQGGNKVYNITDQEALFSQGFINNGREILNRWTPNNTNTDVPKLYYGRDNVINLGGQANSRFVEDGKFLRLQNATLAYNLGRGFIQDATKGYIQSVRVYVQGQNLAIWTPYKGIDPENTSELGIDNNSVPQLRSFTLGLTVGF